MRTSRLGAPGSGVWCLGLRGDFSSYLDSNPHNPSLLDLPKVGRRVRALPRRIFSRLDRLELHAPLVEGSSSHPQLLRQHAYILAGHLLKFP